MMILLKQNKKKRIANTLHQRPRSAKVGLLLIDKARVKQKTIYECRCDEREVTSEDSTRVTYTLFVYYESIMRELKTRPTYECRCDERLEIKSEESTFLTYTGLVGELEHLKI